MWTLEGDNRALAVLIAAGVVLALVLGIYLANRQPEPTDQSRVTYGDWRRLERVIMWGVCKGLFLFMLLYFLIALAAFVVGWIMFRLSGA